MTKTKTHTVPNSVSVQRVLDAQQNARMVCIVRRDGQALAYYLPEWTANRIPTMAEVMRDARWNLAS
jgi:hypothetical protein